MLQYMQLPAKPWFHPNEISHGSQAGAAKAKQVAFSAGLPHPVTVICGKTRPRPIRFASHDWIAGARFHT